MWNILTDGDAKIDTDLNLIKNSDDWMLHASFCNLHLQRISNSRQRSMEAQF